MPSSRSFSDAAVPGRSVGRPASAEPRPSAAVRALIASRRYTTAMRGRGLGGNDPGASRSISTGGEIAMHRGDARRQLEQIMKEGAED
jgi:hypothetical protein